MGARVLDLSVAEREGFEPSKDLLSPYSLSRGALSTTQPPLRLCGPVVAKALDSNDWARESRRGKSGEQRPREKRAAERLAFRYLLVHGADNLGSLLRLLSLFALDSLEDLFAVHRYFSGSVDTKADLIAFNSEDRHGDIIADDDRFPNPSGQDQH